MNGLAFREAIMPSAPTSESVKEVLERRIKQTQESLNNLNAAVRVLEEQPKLLEALEILRKVGI